MSAPTLERAGELIDAVTLEAAALADAGAIDVQTIPCHGCGVALVAHDDDEQGHPHQVPPAYALALAALTSADRDVMDDIADDVAGDYVPSGRFGPRVSDAGACRRQIWYRERPPAGYVPRTDISVRAATLGQLIHKAAEKARRARYPWKRIEMQIDVPGLDKVGRIDEYDPVLGEVADTKSAGHGKWGKIGDAGPVDSMWRQLRIYGLVLYMLELPVKTLKIVAINRATGDEELFFEDFDPATGQAALDDLVAIATAIEAGAEMPRDGYGPADWRCQWCPALNHCWNVARAEQLERSPVSLTLLGEKPADPAIVWAGLEEMRLRKLKNEAKAAHERAAELVEGLPRGKYGAERDDGGIEIGRSPHTARAYGKAHAELVGLYGLAFAGDPDAPAPDCLPAVPETKSWSTTVGRPRAEKTATRKRKKAVTPAETAAAVVSALTEGTGTE